MRPARLVRPTSPPPVRAAVERARRVTAGAVRRGLGGGRRDAGPEPAADPPGDEGWFGPGSVAWRVHGDIVSLVGGLRALLYQTLHPLTMAGVADHSGYRRDPWGRLERTGAFVAATTYGTSDEARAAIEQVRRVHERVRGVAPDGRPYSADDPTLLAWVHATEVDSFLAAYRRHGPERLADADADRYVAEMARVGREMGADPVPDSRASLAEVLAGYDLRAGRQARAAVRFLCWPPMPVAVRPAYAVVAAAAVDLLPLAAQLELRLVVPPGAGALWVRPPARALLHAVRWSLGESSALAAARARVGVAA